MFGKAAILQNKFKEHIFQTLWPRMIQKATHSFNMTAFLT